MRVYQEQAVSINLSLTAMDCASCGIVFGVTSELVKRREADGKDFYCPNGHSNVYKDSAVEKSKADAKRAKEDADWYKARYREEQRDREATERRLSATRGQVTKLRKRIHNGVCPHCTRHFTNLEAHIKTKHPDATLDAEGAPATKGR